MNDNQHNIIVESLILQIETLKIRMAMLESKLSSSGCSCQSEEEHYSGYCSPQCDCLSQESHDHGACQ
jgi:hypothetical protein